MVKRVPRERGGRGLHGGLLQQAHHSRGEEQNRGCCQGRGGAGIILRLASTNIFITSVLFKPIQYLGMSMSYSLFEFVREKLEELLEGQPEQTIDAAAGSAAEALKTVTLNTNNNDDGERVEDYCNPILILVCTLLNCLFRIKISKAEEGAADQGTEAEDVEPWRGKHRGEGQVRS